METSTYMGGAGEDFKKYLEHIFGGRRIMAGLTEYVGGDVKLSFLIDQENTSASTVDKELRDMFALDSNQQFFPKEKVLESESESDSESENLSDFLDSDSESDDSIYDIIEHHRD